MNRQDNNNSKRDIIFKIFKDILNEKAIIIINSVRLQEAANLLMVESDPKPQVEQDHEGNPVLPTRDQFLQYFERMQANHITDQMNNLKSRWKQEKNPAKLKTLELEKEIAQEVLDSKKAGIQEAIVTSHVTKPTIQKDFKGNPIIPGREEYFRYFDAMPVSQLAAHLRQAQQELQNASQAAQKANAEAQAQKSTANITSAKHASAHLRAIGVEMSVANSILKNKQRSQVKTKKKFDKKRIDRNKKIGNTVTKLAGSISPLAGSIAKHATNFFLNRSNPQR